MASTMQEDLSSMLSRNLTFNNIPFESPSQDHQASTNDQNTTSSHTEQPVNYSITQHYHHSAHLATPTAPPADFMSVQRTDAAISLLENGVDPSALFPSQLTLYMQAEDEQKRRLLELWRISPPQYGEHALESGIGIWPPTSLQREEEMAKLRYERHNENMQNGQMDSNMDQTCPGSTLPSNKEDEKNFAEPYIVSGYDMTAGGYPSRGFHEQQQFSDSEEQRENHYNHAIDPVYQHPMYWQGNFWVGSKEQQNGTYNQADLLAASQADMIDIHGMEDEEML
ncbi:MAG: hypothetical protein M1827_000820 [Pycnora praestabilis]|nr:MAG: hypothetical protein M1827_000820 [Pycnora praestabilis]